MNGGWLKQDLPQTLRQSIPGDVLELTSLSVNNPSPIGRAVLATAGVALALIPLAVIIGTRHTIVVFVIALLFAYVLLPAVSWVEARLPARWPRSSALALIYVVLLIIGASALGIVVSRVVQESAHLATNLPSLTRDQTWVNRLPLPTWMGPIRGKIVEDLHGVLANGGEQIIPYLESVAKAIAIGLGSLLYLIVVPILASFFLKDGEEITTSSLNVIESA